MPSIVVTVLPSTWQVGTRQLFTTSPSTSTEQAPPSPSPQPSLVPVRRSSSRSVSRSRLIGGTSTRRFFPFTLNAMSTLACRRCRDRRCRDRRCRRRRHHLREDPLRRRRHLVHP